MIATGLWLGILLAARIPANQIRIQLSLLGPFDTCRLVKSLGKLLTSRTALTLFMLVNLWVLSSAGAASAREDFPPAESDAHPPHIFAPKSARTSNKNLIYHGGIVFPASHVYVIYWGSVPSDVSDALATFFSGFGGSSYANILTQYMRGGLRAPPSSTYLQLALDTSAPPVRSPKVSTIVNEACAAIGAGNPDPEGIYFVVTANFPKGGGFCAWHSYGTCNATSIPVVYLPNVTGVAPCDIPSDPTNPYGNGGQSVANIAAHELSESITDPFINAWFEQTGAEVGDKCETQFGGPVTLTDGTEWVLQEEWSNQNGGCIQSLP
ncbi:MAG TPA: hypothetical protein VEZ90_05855 [Blastocatellia bacterium]|nr:hypothetical protein [Blastocatellia bacterium]